MTSWSLSRQWERGWVAIREVDGYMMAPAGSAEE